MKTWVEKWSGGRKGDWKTIVVYEEEEKNAVLKRCSLVDVG